MIIIVNSAGTVETTLMDAQGWGKSNGGFPCPSRNAEAAVTEAHPLDARGERWIVGGRSRTGSFHAQKGNYNWHLPALHHTTSPSTDWPCTVNDMGPLCNFLPSITTMAN